MANITLIDPTQSVSLAPAILNQNFQNINSELGQIALKLFLNTSSLVLNGALSTIPNNSAEAKSFIATGATGYLFDGYVSGSNRVFSVNFEGIIEASKIMLDISQTSTLGQVVAQNIDVNESISISGDIQLGGIVAKQLQFLTVIPSNVGNSASNPVDVSNSVDVMIDFSNGGSQYVVAGSDALLKIDTTTLKPNQKITFRMVRKNSVNELRFWNGSGSENLFAKIDYVAGLIDIPSTVYPEMDATVTSSNSWLTCQYVETSPSVFRLVILDSNNVNNI
jgi:hypothetical protein